MSRPVASTESGTARLLWGPVLQRHKSWLLVSLAVLMVLVIRVRLREIPLERDEGEYAYAGQLILQGVAPYGEAYNMKLPGTYAAYAVIMALFGQTPSGIRFGLALVNAASIILVFRIGRRMLDEPAGVVAAATFATLALSPAVLGLAAHATHFVTFFALAGILMLLKALDAGLLATAQGRPSRSRQRFYLLASGLLFGLAFLMKQHGVFFGLFGVLYLLWIKGAEWFAGLSASGQRSIRNRRRRDDSSSAVLPPASTLSRDLVDVGWFVLGCAVPYGITCLALWQAGVLSQFMFWTITYAAKYASAISVVDGPAMLRSALRVVVGPNIGFWLLPWVGALVMWWEDRLDSGTAERGAQDWPRGAAPAGEPSAFPIRAARFFLVALLFCSFASASVGLYFREHYFITVLPVLALLTGVAVSRALYLLKHDKTIELFLALPILGAFGVALAAALIGQANVWFAMAPAEALRSIYGTSLFAEAARAADYVKSHSPKNAPVVVLGSEPEIYFLSHRRSATGFIYMYPLLEEHPYALKLQEQMISEVEHSRPEYAVYIGDDLSWLVRPGSQRKVLDWWENYWPRNFDLVHTFQFTEQQERGSDLHTPGPAPGTLNNILILKRRQ